MLACCLALVVAPQSAGGALTATPRRVFTPDFVFHDFGLSVATRGLTLGSRVLVFADETAMATDLNQDGDTADGKVLHVIDLVTGASANLGLAAMNLSTPDFVVADPAAPHRAGLFVSEAQQGQSDLNGDGDASDEVFFALDLAGASAQSSGLAVTHAPPTAALVIGPWAGLWVNELEQGAGDLNGDGRVGSDLFTWDMSAAGAPSNTGLAVFALGAAHQSYFLIARSEFDTGSDLNGDGDQVDQFVLQVYDAATGSLANTGLAMGLGGLARARGAHSAFLVNEHSQGADLNGDGDQADDVVHAFDQASGELHNLGLAFSNPFVSLGSGASRTATGGLALGDDFVAFHVAEVEQGGADLNDDGDATDPGVVFVYRFSTNRTRNLRLSAFDFELGDESLAMQVSEAEQGADLDGDGLLESRVVHLHDLARNSTWNTGLTSPEVQLPNLFRLRRNWLALTASEAGVDRTGDGDGQDIVVVLADAQRHDLVQTGLALRLNLVDAHLLFNAAGAVSVLASEAQTGRDLDGDGDQLDSVLHVVYPDLGLTQNSGAGGVQLLGGYAQTFPFLARESDEGVDRNGDGDALDFVVRTVSVKLR